jgi:L-aspartate oxidase
MPTLPDRPTPDADGVVRADVVVVGAGVAGLYAATRLPRGLDVVVVDKGTPGESGSSPWAQGGLAVPLGADDSVALHVADTLRAGDGLCDPLAVEVLVREAAACLDDLLEFGARFDREPGYEDSPDPRHLHLAREGGQTVGRSVHTADATGAELVRVLRATATPLVTRLPGTAVSLARGAGGRVTGLWVLDRDLGLVPVAAGAVLLATGGCGGLFAATTNQDGATADGVAMAWRAGAAVRDAEFVQFHPTGLAVTGTWRFLLTEALRGAGATLHDATGHRFMLDHHPDAELAPRHVVARAMLEQPDGVWLDATGIGAEQLAHEFPTVLDGARRYGFDLATQRVPVTPAAHYMVGGVRTDVHGRTSLPGLWAAGEVASTGLHGANRLASNSLTEALVFGRRAARSMADERGTVTVDLGPPPALAPAEHDADALADLRTRLRRAMWTGAGPVRSAASLAGVDGALHALAAELGPATADPVHVELDHAVATARLIVAAARRRPESRGGHVREDHPARDPAWAGVHLESVRTPAPADVGAAHGQDTATPNNVPIT